MESPVKPPGNRLNNIKNLLDRRKGRGAGLYPIVLQEGETFHDLEEIIKELRGAILKVNYFSHPVTGGLGWWGLQALEHPVELFLNENGPYYTNTLETKLDAIRRWMGEILKDEVLRHGFNKVWDLVQAEPTPGFIMISPESEAANFNINPMAAAQFWQTLNLMRDVVYAPLAKHKISLVIPIEGNENMMAAWGCAPDLLSVRSII